MVCQGARPYCDEGSMACVECLGDVQCPTGRPVCVSATHACVACHANADCVWAAGGPICEVATGACRGCAGDGECAGMVGTTVCREETGACVECTVDAEAVACGGASCGRATGACTGVGLGTVGTCRQCQGDSECGGGDHCVPMMSSGTLLGFYCLHDVPVAGCGATTGNPDFLPYSVGRNLVSVDGVAVDSCGLRESISCEAVLVSGDTCVLASGASAGDDACGRVELHDGLCVKPTPQSPARCSYRCANNGDCSAGSICNGASPRYCE